MQTGVSLSVGFSDVPFELTGLEHCTCPNAPCPIWVLASGDCVRAFGGFDNERTSKVLCQFTLRVLDSASGQQSNYVSTVVCMGVRGLFCLMVWALDVVLMVFVSASWSCCLLPG